MYAPSQLTTLQGQSVFSCVNVLFHEQSIVSPVNTGLNDSGNLLFLDGHQLVSGH